MIVHVETSRSAHSWQHTVAGEIIEGLGAAVRSSAPIFGILVNGAIKDLQRSVDAEGLVMPDGSAIISMVKDAFQKGAVVTEKVNSDNDVEALLDENAVHPAKFWPRTLLLFGLEGHICPSGCSTRRVLARNTGHELRRFLGVWPPAWRIIMILFSQSRTCAKSCKIAFTFLSKTHSSGKARSRKMMRSKLSLMLWPMRSPAGCLYWQASVCGRKRAVNGKALTTSKAGDRPTNVQKSLVRRFSRRQLPFPM